MVDPQTARLSPPGEDWKLRFAALVPRHITHTRRQKGVADPLARSLAEATILAPRPVRVPPLVLSAAIPFDPREVLAGQRRVEGMTLKWKSSTDRVDRVRGEWWKWKVEPFVRTQTVEKFGPVRKVAPELAFKFGFEGKADTLGQVQTLPAAVDAA